MASAGRSTPRNVPRLDPTIADSRSPGSQSGAVELVVVGLLARESPMQRQARIGSVRGLQMGLFISARHDRFSGPFRYSPGMSRTSASRPTAGNVSVCNPPRLRVHFFHTFAIVCATQPRIAYGPRYLDNRRRRLPFAALARSAGPPTAEGYSSSGSQVQRAGIAARGYRRHGRPSRQRDQCTISRRRGPAGLASTVPDQPRPLTASERAA